MVIDADSGKIVGDIPDTPGVHGIALAPELGPRLHQQRPRRHRQHLRPEDAGHIGSKVKVGDNPDAILYDPATKRVFTFNGRSQDSTAIDAASGKVLGTIKLDGKPEFAASDAKGEIFVNIEDKSELTAIDPNKLEVKAKWPLAPCTEPSGLAIDRKNRRLFVGCDNKMMAVVDADSGKVLATPAIGDGVDATAFDPETGLAFASCGEGVLTVVKEESADKFSVAENVPTQAGRAPWRSTRKTHNVFVVTAKFGAAPARHDGQSAPPATDASRQLRGAGRWQMNGARTRSESLTGGRSQALSAWAGFAAAIPRLRGLFRSHPRRGRRSAVEGSDSAAC